MTGHLHHAEDVDRPVRGDRAAMADHFEQSAQMLAVLEGDDLVVVAANDTLLRMFPGKPLVGAPVAETFAELGGQQILDIYEECYRTGQTVEAKEWRLVTRPGVKGEERVLYVDFLHQPWFDESGSTRGVLVTASDVTDSVTRRLAAEAARHEAERRVEDAMAQIVAMQEVLLPDALPVVPGVELAARYLLADDDTAAGGDWFDAVTLPDDAVAIVVGDVVGHGVAASAVMGQLRAVLRQRLLAGASLTDAMRDLDAFAETVPGAEACTVCVVRIDATGSALEYCTAGHPPLLVVGSDGDARYLEVSGSRPLATGSGFATRRAELDEGDVVVLYTDGLVERPGRTPAQNTVELLDAVRNAVLDRAIPGQGPERVVERVCQQTLEHLIRRSGHADDVTLLVARRGAAPAPLRLDVPAAASSLDRVRDEVSTWLDAFAPTDLDRAEVQLAVDELVANSVLHAYADADGDPRVSIAAQVERDGTLSVTVADQGAWQPPGDGGGEGGRGLGLVRATTDRLTVVTTAQGTRVHVRRRLCTPATLVSSSDLGFAVTPPPRRSRFTVERVDGTLRAAGPLDLLGAPQLEAAICAASTGGTRLVDVDLDDVTLLTSAGVRILHRFAQDGAVRLLARPGTPAQHVLDLVALPYERP